MEPGKYRTVDGLLYINQNETNISQIRVLKRYQKTINDVFFCIFLYLIYTNIHKSYLIWFRNVSVKRYSLDMK